MRTTFIYALCEPGTRTVRYIGQTNSLKRRFRTHLKASVKKKTHLGYWLRSLSEKPFLVVLHEVEENESWHEEERRYISCARAMGMELVNATDGGEGTSGRIYTPEVRAAMSVARKGVPKPPRSHEHLAALSAARKGVPIKPCSPERRAAISATMKGVPKPPRSPEHCAALSAARKGVPWSSVKRAVHEARRTS